MALAWIRASNEQIGQSWILDYKRQVSRAMDIYRLFAQWYFLSQHIITLILMKTIILQWANGQGLITGGVEQYSYLYFFIIYIYILLHWGIFIFIFTFWFMIKNDVKNDHFNYHYDDDHQLALSKWAGPDYKGLWALFIFMYLFIKVISIYRGAFFAWRAPILSWPRIMYSQVRMLKFLEPSREMP